MPEGANIEVAQQLHEKSMKKQESQTEESHQESRKIEVVEIVEAILLAVVTIFTAWSGYQAAKWDGHNAEYYGQASKQRLLATRQSTLAGQTLLYNANTFNSWGAATTAGDSKLANFYVQRFTLDYRVAFNAWLKTDPVHNPKAPPGPSYMPQYHNPAAAAATRLDNIATDTFQKGTDARETGDKYVRITVLLASILFLVAIGQRFKFKRVRETLLGVAFILLIPGLYAVLTLPKA